MIYLKNIQVKIFSTYIQCNKQNLPKRLPVLQKSNTRMTSNRIPDEMLRHLEYLRNLHLEGPRLGNTYLQDSALIQYSEHILGNKDSFKKELTRLGDRFNSVYIEAARDAEFNEPKLEQFTSYGERIDKIHLSEGWKQLAQYSAEDGIVAMAYEEDKHNLGIYQRYGQLISLYMYHPSSGLYGCPLAMTDGAAYTLRTLNQNINTRTAYINEAFERLTSRKNMWTSGQWMTEKKGGSDVSNTETVAIRTKENRKYKLYGYKWFTSATDSMISLGLGKIIPQGIEPKPENISSVPVSLFFIKLRDEKGKLNNMEVIRMKDKLGTRQLPTAQILLKGTQAYLLGQQGKGVKMISKMLTVTRLYNSATAVGIMRRGIALVRDYSDRRIIGKNKLADLPLHLRVLSDLDVIHRGNLIFYLKISELFSKQHAGKINQDQANILRVMTPLLKLYTGKQVLKVISECLQSFGGMGFIQRTSLPNLLRDAQVLSIWQGTTNVLCSDFVRAVLKQQNKKQPLDSLNKFFLDIFERLSNSDVKDPKFTSVNEKIVTSYTALMKDWRELVQIKFRGKHQELRNICFGVSQLFSAILLQQHAVLTMREKDIEIAYRWVEKGIYRSENYSTEMDKQIAMDLNGINLSKGVGIYDSRGVERPKF